MIHQNNKDILPKNIFSTYLLFILFFNQWMFSTLNYKQADIHSTLYFETRG